MGKLTAYLYEKGSDPGEMKIDPCRRFRERVMSLDREEGMRSGATLSGMGTTGGF